MDDIFRALSEKSRLRILSLLMEDEMCVCEIEASLKMTQSNTSRHLAALKKSGILENFKKAQWAYYRISASFKRENRELWEYLQRKLFEIPTYQADHDEYKKCQGRNLCNL